MIVNELQERIDSFHKLGSGTTATPDINKTEPDIEQDNQDSHHRSFEDNLLRLNTEWNEAVQGIELMCVQNEETTNKWWDFARLKKKVVRWIEKKENDAKDNEEGTESFESILKNKDKYKVSVTFKIAILKNF